MPKARASKRKPLVWVLIACAIAAALTLLWRFTPLAEVLQPQKIAERLESIEKVKWAPFAFVAAYVLGGLVMFPVTVLGAAAAIIFPPLKAVSVSFTGIMLSASLLHWAVATQGAGAAGARQTMKSWSTLSDQGVVTIATMRMIPIAPFTLVNLAAGGVGVPFRDLLLGLRSGWRRASPSSVCSAGK